MRLLLGANLRGSRGEKIKLVSATVEAYARVGIEIILTLLHVGAGVTFGRIEQDFALSLLSLCEVGAPAPSGRGR